MSQKGSHTWDLIVHYHRCPDCGYIIENRDDFQYEHGKYVKNVKCGRCHKEFIVQKERELSFGPLIGDVEPAEIDWNLHS